MPRYTLLRREKREPGSVWFAKEHNPDRVFSIHDANLTNTQIDQSMEDGYMSSFSLRRHQENNKRTESDYVWMPNRDTLAYRGTGNFNSFSLAGPYGKEKLPESISVRMAGLPRSIKKVVEEQYSRGRSSDDLDEMMDTYRAAEDLTITGDGHIAENPNRAYRTLMEKRQHLSHFPDLAATRRGRSISSQLKDLAAKAQKVDGSGGMDVSDIKTQVSRMQGTASLLEAKRKRDMENILASGGERIRDRMTRWMLLKKKPEYVAKAEAGLEDAKASATKSKASRLRAQNEMAKARGKGRYTGTPEEVKVRKAVAKEQLMGSMLGRRQISYEMAQIKRKRQAAAAAEYFQRRMVEQESKRVGRGRMITAEHVKQFEELAKMKTIEDDLRTDYTKHKRS